MTVTKVEISNKTIIFTTLFLLGLWFLYQVRGIMILIFIAFILMTAFNPIVVLARRRKIPILPLLLLIYIGILMLLSMVVASLVPAVIDQSRALTQSMPQYLHTLEETLNIRFDAGVGTSYLSSVPSNVLRFAAGAFSNVLNILAVFFITYYLTMDRPNLHKYLLKLFPKADAEKRAEDMIVAVEKQVGGWVRGQLTLMLVIGIMTYVGLLLLGLPYALPLAVLAGILELVPNIGPIFAAIPAILIGLSMEPRPWMGLGATVLSILIQQLENNLIVPRIMQSATGTKPLITILVLLTGYTLGGAIGAILAMPLYLVAQTVYDHITRD